MEIKRYDIGISREDGHIHEEMIEDPCGNYFRRTDVEANMIPRPDLAEIERLIDELINAHEYHRLAIRDHRQDLMMKGFNRFQQAKAALMKAIGH